MDLADNKCAACKRRPNLVEAIRKMFKDVPDAEKVLIDVKGLFKIEDLKNSGIQWWRLQLRIF